MSARTSVAVTRSATPGFAVTGFNLLPGVAATAKVRTVGEVGDALPVGGL